jgi:hypothetical protein
LDLLRIHEHYNYLINRCNVLVKETNECFLDLSLATKAEFDLTNELEMDDYEAGDYEAEIGVWLGDMSVIIAEEWPESASKLGIKLKNAFRIWALAVCENNNEVRLILLCSALEAMLLIESDRDAIASKLAERTAFLIAKPKDRLENYYKVKQLYDKRCRFVHQSDQRKNISVEDCIEMESIVHSVFVELQVMLFTGWQTLHEKDDRTISVIDYINNLKFEGGQ